MILFLLTHLQGNSKSNQETIWPTQLFWATLSSKKCVHAKKHRVFSTPLTMNYYVNFLGRLVCNGLQQKWRFGTHCHWKNKNPGWGPFWSYQLNSTANSAHLARFWGKWADWHCFLVGSSNVRPPGFWFFQLPCLPIIHLMWKALITGRPHFSSTIIQL